MALFRKFFYRKPPDGLLEISERVYVFDCCFSTDVWEDNEYKVYIGGIVGQLREQFLDASFLVFNFREGEKQSLIANILSEYDMTVMDYPRQYEGCPLLTMETIHHFLRSSESWLSLSHKNVLLLHCERGGWLVLAFMLAALLIYRKQYTGEHKTLDMIYKQAPRELLQLMSPLNPMPSQLRYLQYITRRNVGARWPPLDGALTLDCIIIRLIPNLDGEGGCRPLFRIYGQDPFMAVDRTPKVLFSTPKRSKLVRYYKQADCELVKIDIHCHIQGDVVLECISLDHDLEREEMMFRIMFNTAFIRSNILMLNRDEIDILWNIKDQFPKDFRAEILFSEMDAGTSLISIDSPGLEEKDGLPVEAFAKVQESFSSVDWLDPKTDAALNILQRIASSNAIQKLDNASANSTEPTAEELNLENSIKSPTFMAQGNHGSGFAHATETGKLVLESKLKSGSDVKSSSSAAQGRNDSASADASETGRSLAESITAKLKAEPKEPGNNIKTPTHVALREQSMLNFELSVDANLSRKKIEPQELQVSILRPVQSKFITQRVHKASPSAPASYCSSLQGSPVSMSRYQSTSSALGITALLHDHVASSSEQITHPVTVSPTSRSTSAADLTAPKSVQPGQLCIDSIPPPRLPSSPSQSPTPSSLQSSGNTIVAKAPVVNPLSPLPAAVPQQTSDTLQDSEITLQGRGQSALVPTSPPPPPSLLGASPSSFVKSSVSTPPPPPPPPPLFVSGASPRLSVKNLISSPPPPPAPPLPTSLKNSVSVPLPPPSIRGTSTAKNSVSVPNAPPPPPPPFPGTSSSVKNSVSAPPPPPPPPFSGRSSSSTGKTSSAAPPPPPPPSSASSATCPTSSALHMEPSAAVMSGPPPPPPPPLRPGPASTSAVTFSAPPPPPPPAFASKESLSKSSAPVPPPPLPNGVLKTAGSTPTSPSRASNLTVPSIPGPPSGVPFSAKGRGLLRTNSRSQTQPKKANLKPYHWLKLTRAMQGSLWAEAQKTDEATKAPEFDMSELESLFSAATSTTSDGNSGGKSGRRTTGPKSEKVQLIELRRAYNCEIMLTKVKIPLPDLMSSVLALDESALDVDQVENLIKFCPTKEEMELLKAYNRDNENLGKCEQFFLELMKVPRVEPKLRVFSFKIQFYSQVSDLRKNLNTVNSVADEIRNSEKLKRTMQTILSLGNALNHGTARGSAIGFRLDSLLKLTDTRARNNKMTLMHYLCKVLAEKLPELLDFPKDLVSLEASTKIQLKYLAEEMQAISKGLEKVVQELTASDNDGPVSENFCKALKEFLGHAEAEVRSLALLYSNVGRNADALALYFGEDPARCPFEQVVSTLLNFVRMFVRAHGENCKQLEFERKKALKEAENEKMKAGTLSRKESGRLIQTPIKSANIKS
ncbi:hypothetical protein ACLB2K_009268 [Fragaria x ananassa]